MTGVDIKPAKHAWGIRIDAAVVHAPFFSTNDARGGFGLAGAGPCDTCDDHVPGIE